MHHTSTRQLAKSVVKLVAIILFRILFSMSTVAQTTFRPVRINCGGSAYTDPGTKLVWKGDASPTSTLVTTKGGGARTTTNSICNSGTTITNTTANMKPIYCSRRFFWRNTTSMQQPYYDYSIPVLSTTEAYIVRLHFAEMVRHNTLIANSNPIHWLH
jgi:Malectin domain